MAAKVDALLEAIVTHVSRHGGANDVLDEWARYKGEPTNDERTAEAQAEADAEQEKGKEANRKAAEEAAKEAE
jgi:hypothetical protein